MTKKKSEPRRTTDRRESERTVRGTVWIIAAPRGFIVDPSELKDINPLYGMTTYVFQDRHEAHAKSAEIVEEGNRVIKGRQRYLAQYRNPITHDAGWNDTSALGEIEGDLM